MGDLQAAIGDSKKNPLLLTIYSPSCRPCRDFLSRLDSLWDGFGQHVNLAKFSMRHQGGRFIPLSSLALNLERLCLTALGPVRLTALGPVRLLRVSMVSWNMGVGEQSLNEFAGMQVMSQHFKVEKVPTVLTIHQGSVLDVHVGSMDDASLTELLSKISNRSEHLTAAPEPSQPVAQPMAHAHCQKNAGSC